MMSNTIVLISCGAHKLSHKSIAEHLYTSERFKKSIVYAKRMTTNNNVFILSAKHGLLPLDREIEPYDKTLLSMSLVEKKKWANEVIDSLKKVSDITNDEYVFLTEAKEYSEYIVPFITHYTVPMIDWPSSKISEWLDDKINRN
jgi:hypothetical protein